MKGRLRIHVIFAAIFVMAPFFSPAARAQDDPEASKGINSGDYNIHQTIEFGYRSSNINGNLNTYNTFENLTFTNFGYGGDPNNVSRMHVEKNKWYDFRLLFRRDKNFWDYNLFANPLNPASLNPPGSLSTGCFVGPPTSVFPQ